MGIFIEPPEVSEVKTRQGKVSPYSMLGINFVHAIQIEIMLDLLLIRSSTRHGCTKACLQTLHGLLNKVQCTTYWAALMTDFWKSRACRYNAIAASLALIPDPEMVANAREMSAATGKPKLRVLVF